VAEHRLSKVRACQALKLSRSTYYRRPGDTQGRDSPVIDALKALVEKHPRWGFGLCFDTLRLNGCPWNHKRVYRVYKAMGLNLPRRKRRRLPDRPRQPLDAPPAVNHIWSLDFMSDARYGGKRFRTLNIIDDGVREVLSIVVDTSIPGARVVRTLEQLAEWRGVPKALRMDNGPELLSQVLVDWCHARGVQLRCIQPVNPTRMRSSNVLTKPTATKCWTPTCSPAWTRCEPSPTTGDDCTTKNDPIGVSDGYLRHGSDGRWKSPETLVMNCPLDGEDYVGTVDDLSIDTSLAEPSRSMVVAAITRM